MKSICATRLAAMVLAVGLGFSLSASAQEATKSTSRLGPDDMVLRGDAKCTGCHEDESGTKPTMLGERPWILSIGKTKHGTAADGRTPSCATCHGASEAHREEGKAPDRVFKKTAPAEVQNQVCASCHKGGTHMFWTGSIHETQGVACTSCHDIHNDGHDKVRDKHTQAEVCLTCHKEQRAQLNRPSHHPIKEGKVACSDCHNPHGTLTPKLLVRDNVNNTCYQCHMEKRGPFVRTHQPVQEDCTICHNPHGTVNANLLKHRPPFLCQQCHEPTSHRGIPGSLTGTGTRANSMARGCVNCHTNIHGTNNPSNLNSERSIRR